MATKTKSALYNFTLPMIIRILQEGLRPVSNGDGVEFKLQDGIFKEFCQKAKEAQLIGGQDNFDEAWDSYLEYINVLEEKNI